MMHLTCLDLEGVLIPEIWIGLSQQTGIKELELTTRDVADYDELMRHRLEICKKFRLGLPDIQRVVENLIPLEGAQEFLVWLRKHCEVIIISDTFREFVKPLMVQLRYPTLFCHSLVVNGQQRILDYKLRQQDQKRHAVSAFRALNFKVSAVGDSYNDIPMLEEADHAILFRPPQQVMIDHKNYPVMMNHQELKRYLSIILSAD